MASTAYVYNISEKERKTAQKGAETLESLHLDSSSKKNIEITIDETEITIPRSAFPILQEILNRMATGQSISFDEPSPEMTTQEAADFLNVSRPYFIKLLEQSKLPFHRVGNRRKVMATDVLAFKEKIKLNREKGLAKLTTLSQEIEGENY
jgi:excisionase family DNA binding protein